VPVMLQNLQTVRTMRRLAFELGSGRAVDNARREIEATRVALARVDALARHVPPAAGESSPEAQPAA